MSDKQVREAAQRIIESQDSYYSACRDIDRVDPMSALTVARAWLAEHPEDDDEPVTVEWLQTLKNMTKDNDHIGIWFCHKDKPMQVFPEDGDESSLSYDGEDIFLSPTRGDVRRLARALRVELGEGR